MQYTVYVFTYLCISIKRDHAVLKWRSWSSEQQYFCKLPPYVILHVDDGGALKIHLWFFKATTDPLSLPRALESSGWSLDAGCGGCGDYWWISSPVGRHLFLRNQVEFVPEGGGDGAGLWYVAVNPTETGMNKRCGYKWTSPSVVHFCCCLQLG